MFDPAYDFLTEMDWWSVQGVTHLWMPQALKP